MPYGIWYLSGKNRYLLRKLDCAVFLHDVHLIKIKLFLVPFLG